MEKGGKRPGAGRPPVQRKQKQISLKLDADIADVFDSDLFQGKKNRYINDAIREKMLKDGLIKK